MADINKLQTPIDAYTATTIPKIQEQCAKAAEQILKWSKEVSRNCVSPTYRQPKSPAESSANDLKIAAADQMGTPLAMLLLLAEDENADIRLALAENHNISRDVLLKLSEDENPYVAYRANKTLARLRINDSEHISWRSCLCA